MFQYRLYCLDGHGRILHPHVFHAEDDDEALKLAGTRDHLDHDCELWRGAKIIASLPAQVGGAV